MPQAISAASWHCLSYPVAVEPLVRLGDQARMWSAGFYLLIALIAASGVMLWRGSDREPAATIDGAAVTPPTWRDAAFWVLLAGSALGAPGRGDRPHLDRCRCGAPALGSPARALSSHLCGRVRAPPDHSSLVRRCGPAPLRHRPGRRHHLRADQEHRRIDRRACRGVLRVRLDVPRRVGADAASRSISHRLLSVDVGGRGDRRHRRRIGRSSCVQLGG